MSKDLPALIIRQNSRRHSSQPQLRDFLRESRCRRKSKLGRNAGQRHSLGDDASAGSSLTDLRTRKTIAPYSFRGLVRSIIIWLRFYHYHSSQVRTVLRFFATVNLAVLDNEVNDVLFSTSKFKPDKTPRLTATALEALKKEPHARTIKDCVPVVNNSRIKRELRKFDAVAELPEEIVNRLTTLAWHQEFEPLSVIIREGDFPLYFYLILSGSVVVSVVDKEKMEANTVCTLEKGDSFGELAILEDDRRKSSVITRETTHVLVLDSEDYKQIFMKGDLQILKDNVLRTNACLQSFPMEVFAENPKEFMCSYFRPGTILVEDSKLFPWIFIVRSGSCRVIIKVRQIGAVAEERRRAELARRRRINARTLRRTASLEHVEPHEVALRRAMWRHLHDLSDSKAPITSKMLLRELNIDIEDDVDCSLNAIGREDMKSGLRLPPITDAFYQQVGGERRSRVTTRARAETLDALNQVTYWDDGENVQGKRTLATDLNKDYYYQVPALFVYLAKQRQYLHCDKSGKNQYVTIQHLHQGMTFGLVHHFFEKQPSVKVVSDGCECFVFNKDFYLRHASSKTIASAGSTLRPFPSPEEIVDVKVSHLSWSSLRRDVMSDTLDSLARRHFNVHNARQKWPV